MKVSRSFLGILGIFMIISVSSCKTFHASIKEPNNMVNFDKSDFIFSPQVVDSATTTKIFGINFNLNQLFTKHSGNIIYESSSTIQYNDVPVIGNIVLNRTKNIALYNLMNKNSEYDVVFYPRFKSIIKKPILGIGFFYKKSKVIVKARLGKIKQ